MASMPSDQRAPRRRWPLSEKQRIVELTLREGASIRAIAREEGVHPTSLCHWRARYRAGKLTSSAAPRRGRPRASNLQLLPVTVAPALACSHRASDASSDSVVHLNFSSGVTLRIQVPVLDAALLCALIAQLR